MLFPSLSFLSLISTLKSSSKINMNKGIILKIHVFQWGVGWPFLCNFCSRLFSRQCCSQELAVNDFKLYDVVFSLSPERVLTLMSVSAFLMNSICSSKMKITNISNTLLLQNLSSFLIAHWFFCSIELNLCNVLMLSSIDPWGVKLWALLVRLMCYSFSCSEVVIFV